MILHEIDELLPVDTILIVISRITIIPNKRTLANIKFSNLFILISVG